MWRTPAAPFWSTFMPLVFSALTSSTSGMLRLPTAIAAILKDWKIELDSRKAGVIDQPG